MESLTVHFIGPLSFNDGEGSNSLFASPLRDKSCVYLWTIQSDLDQKYYIHYIGEATSFAARQREHLIHILGLDYGILDPLAARRGKLTWKWDGLWRDARSRRKGDDGAKKFFGGAARALEWYKHNSTAVSAYVASLAVFVAEINPTESLQAQIRHVPTWNRPKALLQRGLRTAIEGTIGWNLRNNHPDARVLYPLDQHIGTSASKLSIEVPVSWDQPIAGLDSSLSI